MDERRVGEGEPFLSPMGVFSELKFRACQKSRGEVALPSIGDDWNGDESLFRFIF